MKKLACAVAFLALTACGSTFVSETGGSSGTGASSTSSHGVGAGTTSSTSTSTSTTSVAATSSGAGGSSTTVAASSSGHTASSTSGSAATTTSSSTTSTSSGNVAPCPPAEPTEGTPCAAPDQYRCTYGDATRPDCRDVSVCTNGLWTTTKSTCVEPPPGACPNPEPMAGTVCGTTTLTCTYSDSICFCGCGGGPVCMSPFSWNCAGPPTTKGCPAVIPNGGTPCSDPGVQCTYGVSCTGSSEQVTCTDGYWDWGFPLVCA